MVKIKECMACGGRVEHYLDQGQLVVECRGKCVNYQMIRCDPGIYDQDTVNELLSYENNDLHINLT